MQKLNSNKDEFNVKFIKALEIISDEEVEHVRKGDFLSLNMNVKG